MGPVPLPTDLPNWQDICVLLKQLSQTEQLDDIFSILASLQRLKYSRDEPLELPETPFEELRAFFKNIATQEEERVFVTVVIQTIAIIASELETLIPEGGIKFIPSHSQQACCFQKRLLASLLANGFLCLFPDAGDLTNSINFDWFYESLLQRKSQQGKLRCFLHFFERLSLEWGNLQELGVVTFARVVLSGGCEQSWEELLRDKTPLCAMNISPGGKVEGASSSFLKVLFSDRDIGGEVLQGRCLQEEVMMSVCPELMIAKLIMGPLMDREVILVEGCTRYSQSTGYGSGFKYKGDFVDNVGRDKIGHMENKFVLIDALSFSGEKSQQYSEAGTLREINKAYSGFLQPNIQTKGLASKALPYQLWKLESKLRGTDIRSVATSLWGSGANATGDEQLNWALQWIAASLASCPDVRYFTVNETCMDGVQQIAEHSIKHKWTLGELANCVQAYCKKVNKGKANPKSLLLFLTKYIKRKEDTHCSVS